MKLSEFAAFRLAKDYIDGVVAAISPLDISDKPARQLGKIAISQDGSDNAVQLTGSSIAVANVQNVTTAGTRVQLSSVACREITIIAKRANTGYIYVGGATVSSTVYGADLAALDSITLPVSNANEIYIDASVSGEGISYVAV